MCYTPLVSILTSFIEFFLVVVILAFFRKSFFRNSAVIFIILLGTYQMTEFMLCTSQNPAFWAIVGFLTYNFLPAIGIHHAAHFSHKKINTALIYALPTSFAIVALITNFIIESTCNEPFITVRHLFFQTNNLLLPIFYFTYYFGFIIFASMIFLTAHKKEKNKIKKKICILELIGIAIITIPAVIFTILFPILSIKFPSIYCHFALLFAILLFVAVYLKNKLP